MKKKIQRKLNFPEMISKFIASDSKDWSASLYDNEIDKLKRYLYEYDVQVEIIEEKEAEGNEKTPINHFNRKNGKKTIKLRKLGED